MSDLNQAMWRMRTVRERTGFGKSTIDRMVKAGTFPARRRMGESAVGWLASEVIEWMETRPRVDPGCSPDSGETRE